MRLATKNWKKKNLDVLDFVSHDSRTTCVNRTNESSARRVLSREHVSNARTHSTQHTLGYMSHLTAPELDARVHKHTSQRSHSLIWSHVNSLHDTSTARQHPGGLPAVSARHACVRQCTQRLKEGRRKRETCAPAFDWMMLPFVDVAAKRAQCPQLCEKPSVFSTAASSRARITSSLV